jgi:hypothetical protein
MLADPAESLQEGAQHALIEAHLAAGDVVEGRCSFRPFQSCSTGGCTSCRALRLAGWATSSWNDEVGTPSRGVGMGSTTSTLERSRTSRRGLSKPATRTSDVDPERSGKPASGTMAVQLAMRNPVAAPAPDAASAVTTGLKLGLTQWGRADLWGLLSHYSPLSGPGNLPRLLPDRPRPALSPFQQAFGPLNVADAGSLAPHVVPPAPDLTSLLAPPGRTPDWDLWVIYENDGAGIVPNFGSGSDSGRTAALYVVARRRAPRIGLSRIGVTPMEMTTPPGILTAGAPRDPSSTYTTPPGPYSGVLSFDVGVTVHARGQTSVEVFGSAGVDSPAWGKLVQDYVHTELSNSPLFPWPTGTKPLAELGVAGHQTLNDLVTSDFRGLTYAGRLEIDESVVIGTRRTEGSLRARFVVRTAALRTPLGPISLEFSPMGVLTRAFMRYNDGRTAALAGVEAGVSSSFMVDLGPVGLGLVSEMMVSTDPAFRTGVEAGAHPAGTSAVGWLSSGPAGHHGIGQLVLRIGW